MPPKAPKEPKKHYKEVAKDLIVAEVEARPKPYWRKGAGRPSRLEQDPDLQDKIFGLLAQGSPVIAAHVACGVSKGTYDCWLQYKHEGKEQFVEHFELIAIAQAQFECSANTALWHIGLGHLKGGQPSAIQYLLEKRNPAEYYMTKRVEITGANGAPFNAQTASMDEIKIILNTIDNKYSNGPGQRPSKS